MEKKFIVKKDYKKESFDLRSCGLFGKKPIIGILMFLVGILVFIVIAYNFVNQGPLIKLDLPLAEFFHALALKSSPLVINIMIAGYYIGLQGIAVVGVLLAFYFLYKKFWRELVMVSVSLGLSGLIFLFVSRIFNRPRPFLLFDKKIWINSPNVPGFPSGHTFSILVCYGLLAYLIVPKIKSYLGKVLVIIGALLMMLYIGLSRLYIGDHYLTDVIAGYAVGIAWSGLVFTLVEWIFRRYHLKKERLKNEKKGH